jgi:hypothetical protein
VDRQQSTLFPECLEDWICEDNPVRVIDVFVGGLDLARLRFEGVLTSTNLPNERLQEPHWIGTHGLGDGEEFEHIKPALAAFVLGDKGLWLL